MEEKGAETLGVRLGDEPALGGGHGQHPGQLEGGELGGAGRGAEDLQLLAGLENINQGSGCILGLCDKSSCLAKAAGGKK